VQAEPDHRVRHLSATLIGLCPLDVRADHDACADFLAGSAAAAVVQSALKAAENDAAANLARAEAAKDEAIATDHNLAAINDDRGKLAHTPITGPHGRRVTPAENRQQLTQTQRVVHLREIADDDEYTKTAKTPIAGHITAVLVACIEVVFTTRVFNVSLTHLVLLSFLPWLAVTVTLAVFNVRVAEWLGRKRRTAREC
jgi:hypothetical protein